MVELKLYGWAALFFGWSAVLLPSQSQEGGITTMVDPENLWFRWPLVAASVVVTWKVIGTLNKLDQRHIRNETRIRRLAREERLRNPAFRFDDEEDDSPDA